MSETPRAVFKALLAEWLDSLRSHGMTLQSSHGGPRISEEQLAGMRAEYLARFDAAGVKVPAYIIEQCAKEYSRRRAEGRFGHDGDSHVQAFVHGYISCAVTFAKGVEGQLPELQLSDGWISVKERGPKPGSEVLAWIAWSSFCQSAQTAQLSESGWCDSSRGEPIYPPAEVTSEAQATGASA